MRRRIPLLLAILAVAVVSACSSTTAPTGTHSDCSGYITSSGECIPG